MRAPHILMTIDCVGGIWEYGTDLARGLSANGYRVTLALMGPPPSAGQRTALAADAGVQCVDTGLPLDWLAQDSDAIAASSKALARLAMELRADLVQLNGPALACEGQFAMPVIGVVHSCMASWWRTMRRSPMPADFAWRTDLLARGLARCDLVVTPTRAFGKLVRQLYALPFDPVTVHNGRDFQPLHPHGMHDHIFTAGRLWDEAKDAALLDDVASRLSVPFFAAGATEGPNGETIALRSLSTLGHIDAAAIAHRLAARPVYVSAARYEPFGLSVLEAAMAGCALILADIPTFRELWSDAALFVAPDDRDGFVAAIEALVGDSRARLDHGEAARRRADDYGVARMAGDMAGHYARLLSGARARARG